MQRLRDSSKQNPTTLRNFIQYEVLQEKPIFNSYRTFCKALGNDTMSYQEFEFWYWRFYNGEVDTGYDISLDRKPLELLKLPLELVDKVVESFGPIDSLTTMQRLRDSSKQNPTTLRNYIQYEVLQEKPIFDSYRTFCKVLGNDAMDYSEFELWYWRFYNGEVDTDYDINLDRKPLELMQLPWEIMDKVVESLGPTDRLLTRYASKALQLIIDHQKFKIPCIQIHEGYLGRNDVSVTIRFNPDPFVGKSIRYRKTLNACVRYCGVTQKEIGGNQVAMMLNDLKTLMKNPKLEIGSLILAYFDNCNLLDKIMDVLIKVSSAMNQKFHVQELRIRSTKPEQIASCLSLLKPNVLEVIDLNQYTEAITNTEQWRNAKIVKVDFKVEFTVMDVGNFRNFPEFHIFLSRVSRNRMVQLRDTLLKFPLFKKCKLGFSFKKQFTIDNVAAAFGVAVRNQTVYVPIDGSNEMLEIRVTDASLFNFIEIERKVADINLLL